jgi:folate-binding Fe-S cluster repair protein YgfZ
MKIACGDLAGYLKGKYYLGDVDISETLRPNHKMGHESLIWREDVDWIKLSQNWMQRQAVVDWIKQFLIRSKVSWPDEQLSTFQETLQYGASR